MTAIVQVDAFTAEPYRGNPAAVCVLEKEADESWMQAVASEMNLSETAFLVPAGDAFNLRWFTPAVEVDLCGHATLASAHVLWESGRLPGSVPAVFHTKSGRLSCTRTGDWIEMDFPATRPEEYPTPTPRGLLDALGIDTAVEVARNRFDYLVEVDSEDTVRAMRPDFTRLRKLDVRGTCVTARGSGDFDFVSRFFAPGSGIDEDPVTGSAHCALAPWWSERLGRDALTGYQASKRGGVVRTAVRGERVLLGGQAVTTLRGEILF